MTEKRARRQETEAAVALVRNMARVMERERARRQLGKVKFAKACGITAPAYISFLAESSNPTVFTIARISQALEIPVRELLFGDCDLNTTEAQARTSNA